MWVGQKDYFKKEWKLNDWNEKKKIKGQNWKHVKVRGCNFVYIYTQIESYNHEFVHEYIIIFEFDSFNSRTKHKFKFVTLSK